MPENLLSSTVIELESDSVSFELSDGVSSSSSFSVEIALFDLLETSKHPNFKEIQALVK